jgi:acyl transferase domain-containing protein
VFLAMMNTNNYAQLKTYFEGEKGLTAYDAMGDAMSIAAGRISHFLGLEGPAMSLDTACSSSLVALHLARQSILSGECDAAIVVGANAILHPGIHITFSKVGLMSRAGRCAAFDASADGYIRGEGCVAVILRRESDAVARGDQVLASIIGTAVNQDGRTPAGTAPNGRAQERVIRSALARVGIDPKEIGYVEAHGTGTPVGDPIEMSAIVNVFGPERSPEEKLYVGSVKSNFGHIEAGAGLLGLVKAALSIKHNAIFPSLHFKNLNPSIDFGQAPIEVPTAVTTWPERNVLRMAGINSFGYSGTNAHAILQQAPEKQSDGSSDIVNRPDELVLFSAKSKESLENMVDQWVDYLSTTSDSLADIAFTTATGRAHLNHRIAVTATSRKEVIERLKIWRQGRISRGLATGKTHIRIKPRVAFMFTGQGAQVAGMGRELYETEARFRQTIDEIAEIMDEELGISLKDVLFGAKSSQYLENTRYVQPALFAIEYALADLLRHWGLEPSFLIGHSVGEIAAAAFGGMLELDDAIRFVVARGRLMGSLPKGGKMLAVGTDLEQAWAWVKGREDEVSVATVNGPKAVVFSGTAAAIAAMAELASEAGLRSKELDVSHAFHSPLMDPILGELTEVADSMRVRPSRIPLISNVSGDFHGEDVPSSYWSDHVRQAVLFYAGMEKVVDAGATLLVEIGPHPALIPAVATTFDATRVQTVPTLRRGGGDLMNLLNGLALLFAKGAALNLDRLFWSASYRKVDLPLYPFRKERYWLEGVDGPVSTGESQSLISLPDLPELHPILGKAVERGRRKAVFEVTLEPTSPWSDHRVLGKTVYPATGYLEMAARGFAALSGEGWMPVALEDVSFERPLLLAYRKPKTVQIAFSSGSNGTGAFKFVISSAKNRAEIFCQGHVSAIKPGVEKITPPLDVMDKEADMLIGPFYGELRKGGLEYGAKFANVRSVWLGEPTSGQASGHISYARFGEAAGTDPYLNAEGAFVPTSIQRLGLHQPLPIEAWTHVRAQLHGEKRDALLEIHVVDSEAQVLAEFSNLVLRRTDTLIAGAPVQAPTSQAFTGLAVKSRAELLELLQPMTRLERVGRLSKWLTAEIKDTMGQAADGLDIESLPPTTAFLEIGLDSLLVTELQRRIQEKLAFRFEPMQGLDYQSIETMAEFLHDEVLKVELTTEKAAA